MASLSNPNTFAGNPLDRRSDLRADPDWLSARRRDPSSWTIALWGGRPLVAADDTGVRLTRLPVDLAVRAGGGEERLLFLGVHEDQAVFAIHLDGPADPAEGALQGFGGFRELRGLAAVLSREEAAIAATAKGVGEWHRRHPFCSACGKATEVSDAGWRRVCPSCKAEHFPRTDAVVIMLVIRGEECLLGRQASWDPGRFSALAGFLEPGESVEEACAREVKEECGLEVTAVRYHSSQPWPWPSNLMIGLHCDVAEGEAAPDQTELEAVKWFSRAETRALLAGELEGLGAPPPLAIAHQLLRSWAEA